MAPERFFRKIAALFFSGSPARQYVKMLVVLALGGGIWFYGDAFLAWVLRPPVSPALEVTALLLAFIFVCLLLYVMVWLQIRRRRTVRTIADGATWFFTQAQNARKAKAKNRSDDGKT